MVTVLRVVPVAPWTVTTTMTLSIQPPWSYVTMAWITTVTIARTLLTMYARLNSTVDDNQNIRPWWRSRVRSYNRVRDDDSSTRRRSRDRDDGDDESSSEDRDDERSDRRSRRDRSSNLRSRYRDDD